MATPVGISSSDVEAIAKTTYEDGLIAETVRNHAVTALVTKEAGGGDGHKLAVQGTKGGGRGYNFPTVISAGVTGAGNKFGPRRYSFTSNWSWTYGFDLLQETDLRAFRGAGERGRLYDLVTSATENAAQVVADDQETFLLGDGFGTIGTISSNTNPSGNSYTLTLTVPSQIINFDIGMVLQSAAPGFASGLDSGVCQVTANDGVSVVTVLSDGTWSPTNTHNLIIDSNWDGTTSTGLMTPGLRAILPLAAPASNDSFQGQNRFADPTNLAGYRSTMSTGNILTDIKYLANQISKNSRAKPTVALVSVNNFDKAENVADNKTRYTVPARGEALQGVFFEGLNVNYSRGSLKLIPTYNMDEDRFYVLSPETFILMTPENELIAPANADYKFVVPYNADARQIRMVCQSMFQCKAPGFNGVGQMNS
jgi:hypothetical protein